MKKYSNQFLIHFTFFTNPDFYPFSLPSFLFLYSYYPSFLSILLFLNSRCLSTASYASFRPTSSIKFSNAAHSLFTFFIYCAIFSFFKSKFFFVFIVFMIMSLSRTSSFDFFLFIILLRLRLLRTWVDEREELLTMLCWTESST